MFFFKDIPIGGEFRTEIIRKFDTMGYSEKWIEYKKTSEDKAVCINSVGYLSILAIGVEFKFYPTQVCYPIGYTLPEGIFYDY